MIALAVAVAPGCPAGDALVHSDEPPMIPVGLDAFRQWDRLPYQRIGVRGYMRSTYDRTGRNISADSGHFLYEQDPQFHATLDVNGPGILYFKRTNHWHGSPWHYEVDGEDFLVSETATADPVGAKERLAAATFIPEALFPPPLAWTWSTTKGADLMWVPIGFEDTLRIGYSRTFYATGYYIYHLFSPGMTHLSQPLERWRKQPPDPAVLRLIERSGTDIAPKDIPQERGSIDLTPYERRTLWESGRGAGVVRALKLKVPEGQAYDLGKCRLRITWDRRLDPSVDAPVDLFFGAGHLYNHDGREFLVRGFPINVRYADGGVELACYYPMPFFRHAKIELEARSEAITGIEWEIRREPLRDPANHVGWFHATYRDFPEPKPGHDNIFLDTDQVEGGGPWSGNFVGMSWVFTRQGRLETLEGDPRFFLDDSRTPQAFATGTEEWGGGGDYWGGETMTLPFAGHPVGKSAGDARDERELVNSAYRFLISDLLPFGRRAVIGLEHGRLNQSDEHYSGVVYWYGLDSPTLELTDELFVAGTEKHLAEHRYESPEAGEPYRLVSRYECGPDHDGADGFVGGHDRAGANVMYYPAEEDRVRTTTGTTRFTLQLNPDNRGALLRRKFDFQYPNQRAQVSVRAEGTGEWHVVGEWYTAGSNTTVHSHPGRAPNRELAPSERNVITGNRRWREEEFLLPRHLTEGVEHLEIKLEHVPDERPLYPGRPYPEESKWSECRYWIYCYTMPRVTLPE